MTSSTNEFKFAAPPPVTAAHQHAVYPELSHDERARLNFVASCSRLVAATLTPGNALAYEREVLPEFERSHKRSPSDRTEVRRAMNGNTFHQTWSALRRNLMEIRQQAGAEIVLRQLNELAERARQLNTDSNRLVLDDSVEIPAYVSEVDHHCMPGSYYRELVADDVAPAANYDTGFFVTTGGTIGPLCDGAGKSIANWVQQVIDTSKPEFAPKRILDVGVAAGHSILPIAQAFPDAEVVAIDVAAPMLRYAHARAEALGVSNITFMQMSGEDLSAFADESFDWVQSSIFLHELSMKALPRVLAECFRVLRPGGLTLHLEQPQYEQDMPLFEQFMRDWDAYNNNEPFWTAMHGCDLEQALITSGFTPKDLFRAQLEGVVEGAESANDAAKQDHGRAAAWHSYGAWRSA